MVVGFTLSKSFHNLYEPQRGKKKHKLKAKASALQLTSKASWPTYITYVKPNIKRKPEEGKKKKT